MPHSRRDRTALIRLALPAGGRRTALPAIALVVAVAVSGCTGTPLDGDAGGGASGAAPGAGRYGVSPLDNPDGTKPGLGPVTASADKKAALELITKVRTAGRGPKTGYDRDEFGYAWKDSVDGIPLARNGCDTRIISMVRAVVGLFSQRMQGVVACA